MTLYSAFNRDDLVGYLKVAVAGDTIQVAAGTDIAEFVIPSNIVSNLSAPVTIKSADINKPATFRGIGICNDLKANFAQLDDSSKATVVEGLVLDGLNIRATRYLTCTNGSLEMPDGDGLGWRIAGTTHPGAGFGGSSDMLGVHIGAGANSILIKNCIFNGFANAIQVNGPCRGITISQNVFEENCDDMIQHGQVTDLIVEWNVCKNFRSPVRDMAMLQGWTFAGAPSGDFAVAASAQTAPIYRYNYLYDESGRVRFGTLDNARGNGGVSTNVQVLNNESQQSGNTAWVVSYTSGLTFARNKSVGLSGGLPSFALVTNNQSITSVANNMAPAFSGSIVNGVNGNAFSTSTTSYPTGWIHIRKDKVTGTARYAGPYGNGGGTLAKPAQLTNAADAVLSGTVVQDPHLAGSDVRRTGVIRIRKAGLAGTASAIRWQRPTDIVSQATVELTDDSTYRNFRMVSNNNSHLLYPSDAAMSLKVLYVNPTVSTTERSNPSSFSLSLDVPVPAGEFWEPTKKLEFPLAKGMYYEGDTVMQAAIRSNTWTKPAPTQIGSGDTTSLSLVQPNTPNGYVSGDFIINMAHKATGATFGLPGNFLAAVFASTSGSGQGVAMVAGRATAANMTLGAYTSATSSKNISVSYRGVNTTTPYYVSTPLLSASAANCTVPGITIPTNSDDNYRLLIWVANVLGVGFITPAGYRQVEATGGTPRITLYEKIDPIRSYAGGTITMTAPSATVAVSMALKLA